MKVCPECDTLDPSCPVCDGMGMLEMTEEDWWDAREDELYDKWVDQQLLNRRES